MPIDLLAGQERGSPSPVVNPPVMEGRDLFTVDLPIPENNVLSWRQAPTPTMWAKMSEWFPGDVKAQSEKATNSLVYSEMFNIRPDHAYEYHDEISRQVRDLLSTEKVVTEKKGIGGALSSGVESSLAGMMAKQKVPIPFESVNQLERWAQGMTAMFIDLPFFLTGYAIGGGTPITGMAGGFGFTGGLRQMLVDRYSKGEVKSIGELLDRTKEAVYKTMQGQIVGAATGYAGSLTKITSLKLASELATMTTAGRLVEGQLPTVQDFIDNAGMLLVMHYGLKGYADARSRIPEIRAKLQDYFVDSGAHPKTIAETIAKEISSDPTADITDVLDRVNANIKATAPVEQPAETTKDTTPAKKTQPEPSQGIETVKPEGQLTEPDVSTSIKNAVVDAEREAMGLPPIETPVIPKGETWREDVQAKVDSGEMNPRGVAQKIKNLTELGDPAPGEYTSREWNQAFEYDKKKLQNEHKAVEDAITEAEKAGGDTTDLQNRRDGIETAINANQKATKATGTEQGRALQSRQDAMNEDYSFSAMIQRAKDDGIPTTPEVRTKLKGLSKKIEKAQQELETFDKQVATDNLEKTVKILKEEEGLAKRKEQRTYQKVELDTEFDSLVREFNKQIGGQLNVGIDPMAVKVLVEMARNRIRSGYLTAEGIVDQIYVALKKAGIEYSKRDIQDAISQYGVTKQMSKEDIAVKLREAKRQMQLLSALEDAKKGVSPARTGLQRDKVSDRVRELQRQVQEAMRETGVRAVSPEQQWRTSLDAVKTRLKHSIADIVKRFETGVSEPKKTGIKYDEAATDLKKFRDKIQEVLDFAEGKTGKKELSPEQKVRMATAAVEKSIAEYERRITENDLAAKKKPSTTPETPELKRLREERDLLKDIFKMMKEEAKPKKTADEIALQSYRTRTENQIKEFERRLSEKDFAPKPKKEPATKGDPELKLQFELDQIKREYAKQHLEWTLEGRSLLKKFGDGVIESVNLVKALKSSFDVSAVGRQGWLSFLAHPVSGTIDIANMFRALRSPEAEFRIHQEILKDKLYPLMKKAGLQITETEGIKVNLEENYQSRWANAIPGIPASNRAFSTYLNLRRVALFKEVYESANFKDGKGTDAELRAIADYVNQSTGRGNIRGYENALTGLGTFLWAPKLVLSRFQMVYGLGKAVVTTATFNKFGTGSPANVAIAKEYGRMLRTLGIIYAVSSLFDEVSIETSTISSDWGKIRIGNRRIDPLAGLIQNTVMMSRVWNEQTKTAGGRILPLTGNVPYGGRTVWTVMSDWGRSKLTPVLSETINLKQGKDVVGNKVTMWDIPEKFLMPLSFGDIYDSMAEDGIPAGAALSILATFGIGVQIYDPSQRKQ